MCDRTFWVTIILISVFIFAIICVEHSTHARWEERRSGLHELHSDLANDQPVEHVTVLLFHVGFLSRTSELIVFRLSFGSGSWARFLEPNLGLPLELSEEQFLGEGLPHPMVKRDRNPPYLESSLCSMELSVESPSSIITWFQESTDVNAARSPDENQTPLHARKPQKFLLDGRNF